MAETIFYIFIAILVFEYLLERLLDYLNSKLWSSELPEELAGIYDTEKYKKSQDYSRTNTRFSIYSDTVSFMAMLLVLLLGGFAFLDSFVWSVSDNPIIMSLIFFGILAAASDLISMPFSIYATFVIEEKFGFNKTTVKTYILDKIKGLALGAVIGGGLLSLVVWIYMISGTYFWLIAWGVISGFMIFMSMFYSNLIVPLFNKYRNSYSIPAYEMLLADLGVKQKQWADGITFNDNAPMALIRQQISRR